MPWKWIDSVALLTAGAPVLPDAWVRGIFASLIAALAFTAYSWGETRFSQLETRLTRAERQLSTVERKVDVLLDRSYRAMDYRNSLP